jgi:hypothetical protein
MVRVSVQQRVEKKICRCSKRNVFMRIDFVGLGNYDQIGRALLNLIKKAKLIRIGYGLYAKARINRITGSPMLAAVGGFDQVAKEALDLLGVKWQPSLAEQNYNTGSTMQIPVNTQVIIKDKFNRTIGTDKFRLQVKRY